MDPKMAPKLVKNLLILGSFFGCLFCWVLKLFGCLLGALLGLPRLSWEASGPQKPSKTACFLSFLQMQAFENVAFWVFETIADTLGFILPPSWADLVPKLTQNGSQKLSKKCPKNYQKNDPRNIQTSVDLWVPKWAPK